MSLNAVLENLIAGFVASGLTFLLLRAAKTIKYRKMYGYVNGRYQLDNLEGQGHATEGVNVRHTGGRGISISCNTSTERWESRIAMSEDIQDFGQGIYQHGGKFDCGIHQIQLDRSHNSIFVYGQNTSDKDRTRFSYILNRQDPQLK